MTAWLVEAGQQRPSVAYTNESSQISDTVLLATKEIATDLKEGGRLLSATCPQ